MSRDLTFDALEKMIEIEIANVLRIVARKTADELINIVGTQWYGSNKPSVFYDRTYDLINSITQSSVRKVGNDYEIEIYFDDSKIHPEERDGLFNAHMSFDGSTSYEGRSIGSWLVEWISETGTSRTVAPIKPIHMIKQTEEWLETNLFRMVQQEFKKIGLPVSVR